MSERIESESEMAPSSSPIAPEGWHTTFDQTVKDSGQGGEHAEAIQIAKLLGHNDPSKVQEFLDDEDH